MKEIIQAAIAATGATFVVVTGIWMMGIFRTDHAAPDPTFTCAQTVHLDDGNFQNRPRRPRPHLHLRANDLGRLRGDTERGPVGSGAAEREDEDSLWVSGGGNTL